MSIVPSIKEVIDIIGGIPKLKRLAATPDQIIALDQRIAALEQRLARCPGEACPFCGALEWRLDSAQPHPNAMLARAGVHELKMHCLECKKHRTVTETPAV